MVATAGEGIVELCSCLNIVVSVGPLCIGDALRNRKDRVTSVTHCSVPKGEWSLYWLLCLAISIDFGPTLPYMVYTYYIIT